MEKYFKQHSKNNAGVHLYTITQNRNTEQTEQRTRSWQQTQWPPHSQNKPWPLETPQHPGLPGKWQGHYKNFKHIDYKVRVTILAMLQTRATRFFPGLFVFCCGCGAHYGEWQEWGPKHLSPQMHSSAFQYTEEAHGQDSTSRGTNSTETDQPASAVQLLGVTLRLELWSSNLALVCPHDGPTAKEPPKDMH